MSASVPADRPGESRANRVLCVSSGTQCDINSFSRTIWHSLKLSIFWCPPPPPPPPRAIASSWFQNLTWRCAVSTKTPSQTPHLFLCSSSFLFFSHLSDLEICLPAIILTVIVFACHGVCFLKKFLRNSLFSSSSPSLSPPSGFSPAAARWGGKWSVQHLGLFHAEQQPFLLPGVHQEPEPVLEGRLRHQSVPRTSGERLIRSFISESLFV